MRSISFFLALFTFLLVNGSKLETPVYLQETRLHIFSFDKTDLNETPYNVSTLTSKDTQFFFDGENFKTRIGETVLSDRVKYFVKTLNEEENSWQYIIILESEDPFSLYIELDFLADKTILLKYPMIDTKTGNLFGYNISECVIIP